MEVAYSEGNGGIWRTRELGFQGPFAAQMAPPNRVVLTDQDTVLSGAVTSAEVISGTVVHKGEDGGAFELRALPACYSFWWRKISPQLQNEGMPTPIFITAQDRDSGKDRGKARDKGEMKPPPFPNLPSLPRSLFNLVLGDTPQEVGKATGQQRERRLARIQQFSMRPDEVKAYLDKYVIKQTTAKEMLAVAICDHYNRAREEVRSGRDLESQQTPRPVESTPSGSAEAASVGVSSGHAAAGEGAEHLPKEGQQVVQQPSEVKLTSNSQAEAAAPSDSARLRFTDTDGDAIELRDEGGCINEYVNGELTIEDMQKFDIDEALRKYTDDTGSGFFRPEEDLQRLSRDRDTLFRAPPKQRNYTKPNVLLLGPTGSGKTYLLKNLAELIGVPFVKADATKFTETGYVGRNAEDVMRELLTAADGDVELAQVGIVYVDEIDKMCAEAGGGHSSFRRGTQSTFLKLMEDTEVTISSSPLQQLESDGTKLSTRHVLFVFSGAFSELDKRLQDEHRREVQGFGFAPESGAKRDVSAELQSLLHRAGAEELVKAGLEPEFVGRIPVRVALGALSEDDLFAILAHAEDGPVAQMVGDFRRYGIQVSFAEDSLRMIAQLAVKEGTGARALVTILEGALRRFKFHLPALVPRGLTELEVTRAIIEDPEEELQQLLARYPAAASEDTVVPSALDDTRSVSLR